MCLHRGGLQTAVEERTLEEVRATFALFFARHVGFRPGFGDLPGGIGQEEVREQVRTNAREQFERQMRAQGLTDIENTEEGTIDIDTGTDRMAAVFPFEGLSFDPDAYREEIRSLASSVR